MTSSDDEARRLARAARAEFGDAVSPATPRESATVGERAGDRIDRYELVQRIGDGGMGTVWRARQLEPIEREVALKVIKLGMDTERVVARFEAERQVLARMDHPNVAAVLDGGATALGRPYFVMDLVDGESIVRYCDRHELDVDARLHVFLQVCSAVEHAHQKGVVHRDLKPSNLLVTTVDGGPHVKVIDFGIAKVTDDGVALATRHTAASEVVGTLEYMAPEQAIGGAAAVDTRADVYSLGVLLYELLTGVRPLDVSWGGDADLERALRTLRENEPVVPSSRVATDASTTPPGVDARRLRGALHGELDWVILKALEKEPGRRYSGAAFLAADVRGFLDGTTLSARPPSRTYRLSKFVRRNRSAVIAGALMFGLLIAGVIGTSFGLVRSMKSRAQAEARLVQAKELNRVLSRMLTSVAPRLARGKDPELLIAVLDDTSSRLLEGEVKEPIVAAQLDLEMAIGFLALGRAETSLVHAERAFEGLDRELGPDDRSTLRARAQVGHALRRLERADEAYESLTEAAARQAESFGDEDSDTLATRRGLGSLLHRMGRVDDAREILTDVVAIERRTLTDAERAAVPSLSELGTLEFFGFQDLDAGKAHLTEALELLREHEGDDHPWALRAMETLSQIEARQGNVDESLAMCAALTDQYRAIYGPEHPETLAAEGNRAFTMIFAGRFDEGDALMREVYEVQRRVVGESAPDTLWTRARVAEGIARGGDAETGIAELRAAIAGIEANGIPPFDDRLSLADLLIQSGKSSEARSELTDLLALLSRTVGEGHPLHEQAARMLASLGD